MLVHKLEHECALKVLYHTRDIELGQLVVDNIVNGIENSRRIIAVISPNFAQSHFCNLELTWSLHYKEKLYLLLYQDPFSLPIPERDFPIPCGAVNEQDADEDQKCIGLRDKAAITNAHHCTRKQENDEAGLENVTVDDKEPLLQREPDDEDFGRDQCCNNEREDPPRSCCVEVPAMIRMLLTERTYLEWNGKDKNAEKLFWKKIVRDLYRDV